MSANSSKYGILKSIATARSEGTTKDENKASYSTDYIVPDLIDFFGDDWKEIKTQIEKRNIHYLNSLLSELFTYKILKNSLIKQIVCTEATSVSLFWGGMFPNRLKTLL